MIRGWLIVGPARSEPTPSEDDYIGVFTKDLPDAMSYLPGAWGTWFAGGGFVRVVCIQMPGT